MARTSDERTAHLEGEGAEIVLGDFMNLESIRDAMKDVNRVFFCYPLQGD